MLRRLRLGREEVAVAVAVADQRQLLPAEAIGDPVCGDAKEPGADVLDRPRQPAGLDQLREHVLQDVLGIGDVGDAAADEAAQAPRLLAEGAGEGAILLGEGSGGGGRSHESVDGRAAEILSAGFEKAAPAARPG